MDKLPADDPRILEALEACRPGSDDLSDPDMESLAARMAESAKLQSLYERLQRLDKALADVYQDVPVPEGLADRILVRLRESPLGTALGTALEEPPPIDAPQPALGPRKVGFRRLRRRWLVGAGALVAVAASVLVAVWLGIPSPQQRGLQPLYHAAIDDFNREFSKGGVPLAAEHPPSAFLPRQGLQIQSRPVRGLLGYDGVAYDMIGPGGKAATLYVLADGQQVFAGNDPSANLYISGEGTAGAWRENGLLYVLVVDGGEHDYRRFVSTNAVYT